MHRAHSLQTIVDYHVRTKHHLEKYAEHLGYFDWETQPDPFRTFEGARRISLDFPEDPDDPPYDAVFDPTSVSPKPLNRTSVSLLFYHSLALSAWKEHLDRRWSLRCNPSSGNLHPTEGYLIAPAVEGLTTKAGLYHYAPYHHELEVRVEWDSNMAEDSLFIGLSTIYWRESWKYGARAFRYCQHDMGHAIGAVVIAAALLGWKARLIADTPDEDLAKLLTTGDQRGPEAEHAENLIQLTPHDREARQPAWPAPPSRPAGKPNRLSTDHHAWPVIDDAGAATARTTRAAQREEPSSRPPIRGYSDLPAGNLIRKRRSAYEMDGRTSLPRDTFFRQLNAVMPGRPPFSALWWHPQVHLALFAHRVDGLAPGCYLLLRDDADRTALASACRDDFAWEPVDGGPDGLFLLAEGDFREKAKKVSCHQDIASDSCYALAMIAPFNSALEHHGPWFYKNLHWETGLIGQVLYLEAEAAGIRSTGIGCFFDDAMHEVLGLEGLQWQSLYHFTVGAPVVDLRLRTVQAYAHIGA